VFVNTAQEHLLVLVLEGEVEGLGGEVPDHVGKVTTPEAAESLFLGDASEAVNDTCGPENKIALIRLQFAIRYYCWFMGFDFNQFLFL